MPEVVETPVMALFLHRAFDPAGQEFVYWTADEVDLDGTFYDGAPPFSTLESPTLLRRIITGSGGIPYIYEKITTKTLVEFEEVP